MTRKSTSGVAVGSGVGVSVGGDGTAVLRIGVGLGVSVGVGVNTGVGVSVGVGVNVGVGVWVGIGVSVGVGVFVGVIVGVGVLVGVGVAVSTNGSTAAAPTAPSSRICCKGLRGSPGSAPSSEKVEARAFMMSDGTIIPHSHTSAIAMASRRSFAPKVRLANQIDRLLRWRSSRRFE